MRVAYLCSRYPAVSHAFVLAEVDAMRRHGVIVDTFSIRRAHDADALSDADRDALATTTAVLPPRPSRLVAAHTRAALRAPRAYATTLAEALRGGRPGVRGRLWQLFYFGEALMVWDECRRRGVDHMHAHFANVGASVAMIAARYGALRGARPRTWSFKMHGLADLYDGGANPLARKIRAAGLVVCASEFLRSQLMTLVEPDHWPKLRVVPTAIDVERFRRVTRTADGDGPLRVLSVARLHPAKGLPLLVDALAEATRQGVPMHATVVGEGPERRALERRSRDLGIELELPGAVGQHELPAFYEQADVFCLPSLSEGLGVVLMEAMATGLPVVATRTMGIPEVVEDGRQGLLVTPGRVDELVAALGRLARDPELRERLGRNGRDRAAAFDVDRAAAALESLLEEAAG